MIICYFVSIRRFILLFYLVLPTCDSICIQICTFKRIINCRYNDIAKYGFAAMGRHETTAAEPSSLKDTSQNPAHIDKHAGLGG